MAKNEDEKIKHIIKNYSVHAQKHIEENKKLFSSFNAMYNKFIKKNNIDPSFEYTKEIIKRMERDKIPQQTSIAMIEYLMPEIKNIRKEVIIMGLPMIIGILGLIIFSLLIVFSKPLSFENKFLIGYIVGNAISLGAVIFGSLRRKQVKFKTLISMMLYQASSAYSAAKMQGQGSFAAFRFLEEMKNNPGKELQIKVNQPKMVYK